MNENEKNDLIKFMFRQWKAAQRERLVFQMTIRLMQEQDPQLSDTLDRLIAVCREKGAVDVILDHDFGGFEELTENIGEGSLEKVIREFQEKFGSKLPIH